MPAVTALSGECTADRRRKSSVPPPGNMQRRFLALCWSALMRARNENERYLLHLFRSQLSEPRGAGDPITAPVRCRDSDLCSGSFRTLRKDPARACITPCRDHSDGDIGSRLSRAGGDQADADADRVLLHAVAVSSALSVRAYECRPDQLH